MPVVQFSLDGIAGRQGEYIHRLLGVSTGSKAEPESMLTADAIDLLASRLCTPLQVQLHLTLALEAGYQTGEKPVTAELVASVLSHHLDDLEPTLTRHGYGSRTWSSSLTARRRRPPCTVQ